MVAIGLKGSAIKKSEKLWFVSGMVIAGVGVFEYESEVDEEK